MLLQGGMLEEHGPYLPAFTDGILSDRLTKELAAGIARQRRGWGGAMTNMTPAEKAADGLSLHGGIDEHSLMLYLRPELVASDYRQAPPVNGANYDEAFATARKEGWPGYLGAPHLATAAFGERIWTSFAAATVKTAVAILDGKDPSTYGRYLTYLKTLPLYREWIASADSRDAVGGTKLSDWLARRKK
ncbi:MAG: creatininase family protein [Acidobacteria bacterium]|nr:creatininase family protein [Acidobacteriota bacterium]